METQAGPQMALEARTRSSPPFLAHQFFPGDRDVNGGRQASFSSRLRLDSCATTQSGVPLEHGQYNGHGMHWDVKTWDWDSVLFLAQPSSSTAQVAEQTRISYQGVQDGNLDRYRPTSSNGMGLRLDGLPTSPDPNGSSDPDDLFIGHRRKHPLGDQENEHRIYSDRAQPFLRDGSSPEEDAESLSLKLGGHSYAYSDDGGNCSRNSKRYRSSSPGPQFPMCQVDDCKADLSHAKDYHRRHKVCEMHAKAVKALVSRLMQRFCQQCSRFHPLTEFDEGKRSCRRRLAGHNRRRRKNQPDPSTARGYMGAEDNGAGKTAGLVGVLNLLSSLQAVSTVGALNGIVNERDAVLQYLRKGVLAAPSGVENLSTAAVANLLNLSGAVSDGGRSELKPQSSTSNGQAHAVVSETEALLSALAIPKTTQALSLLLQSSLSDQLTSAIMKAAETPLVQQANGTSSFAVASPTARVLGKEVVDLASTGPNAGLGLSLSSPMAARPLGTQNLSASARANSTHKQVVAESSIHQTGQLHADLLHGQGTPLAMVQKYLPPSQTSEHQGTVNGVFDVNNIEDDGATESTSDLEAPGSMLTFLEGQDRRPFQDVLHHSRPSIDLQQPPPQYDMKDSSPSGSDQSPSSSYADWQDRTGRISIKLFDRNPGELPQLLRSQILEWLAHRPSDMESYIRPGCTVITIFLSMPNLAWKELETDLRTSLQKLVSSDEFWSNGRIHVQVDGRNAIIVDGKIHISKPSKSIRAPWLLSVRPVAVIAGQRTNIILKGFNLRQFGTRIFCAYQGRYACQALSLAKEEVAGRQSLSNLAGNETGYDELSVSFDGGLPNVVGRAFIEVERQMAGGNALPVIVADDSVCAELQMLEKEIEAQRSVDSEDAERTGVQSKDTPQQINVKNFLDDLGWLFQKSQVLPGVTSLPNLFPTRQKHLLMFAVERDWCAVVSKLLDILFGLVLASPDSLSSGLMEIFGEETSLLHIAVRRKCRPMVQLLLAYVPYAGAGDVDLNHLLKDICKHGLRHKSIFTPDLRGPEGLTPLHIAASIRGAEGIIDALTNDPNQIGLHAWSNALNLRGESPLACALGRGNASYVQLVGSKIAKRDGSMTVNIHLEGTQRNTGASANRTVSNTPLCALELPMWSSKGPVESTGARVASSYPSFTRQLPHSLRGYRGGSMYRPFLVSMVAIAAVCVVVCVVMKSPPQIRCILPPFSWNSLGFGDS